MAYFPLFIDLNKRRVLVVGAGVVASRRIRVLAEFGASVTVVAAEASEEAAGLAKEGKIRLFSSDYQSWRSRLFREAPFFLVLAASGDEEADRLAEEDARRMGAFVNVAGEKERSDFYFPGIAREGAVTAGITTGGADHAMARRMSQAVRRLLKEENKKRQ